MQLKSFVTSASSTALALLLVSSSVNAQSRTTEAGEAQINDPTEECTDYTYAPVQAALTAFPPIWTPCTGVVAGDAAASATWSSIAPSIPTNIQVKGTILGDFSNFTPTYPATDPDCWWSYHNCVTPKLAGLQPDVANVPEPLTLGYGFDDGPNCSHNAFYDFLASQNQKATMFYIGSNVMNWPLEAQRGLADGHEICAHTWSHHYMTAFQSEAAFAELYYGMQAIKLVTGVTPTCWRPPYGDVDDRIRTIANGLGLRTIIWEYDTFDWEAGFDNITVQDVDNNYGNVINDAKNGTFNNAGAIVLTHELNNFTMGTAMQFYSQLTSSFKHIVPVGVALNKTQPYKETNYSLPTFEAYISGHVTNSSTGSSSSGGGSGSSGQSGSSGASHATVISTAGALLAATLALVAFAA